MQPAPSTFFQQHAAFTRLVVHRLQVRRQLGYPYRELIGYAVQGLLEAERSFDPKRGIPFRGFAYARVQGAVLDGVRGMMDMPVGPHRRRIEALRALRETRDAGSIEAAHRTLGALSASSVVTALGHAPAVFAIAAHVEIDPLDEDPVGTFAAADATGVDDALIHAQQLARMETALGILTNEEEIVLRGIYFEERNLDSIGAELGISRSWACRIHARALARLREAIDGNAPAPLM